MTNFEDATARGWQLTINVAAMRRARTKGIDLSMPVSQLQQFVMDDVFLVDALWCIVQSDATAKGITFEQFEASFDGEATERGRDALWEALEAYYDPGKARMLRAALESVKQEMEAAVSSLTSTGSTEAKES